MEKLDKINSSPVKTTEATQWVSYKSSQGRYQKPGKQLSKNSHFLESANDWKIVYDEDARQRQFPQHIVCTAQRPDIVIYSDSCKHVTLIELTCGNEENFEDQRARKERRYEQLMVDIETAGWIGHLFTVEVGCKGFYHHTLPRMFNFFNINRAQKKRTLNISAVVSLKASYTIWLSRNNKIWCDNWELAKRPVFQS